MFNRIEMYMEWLRTDPVEFIISMLYTVCVVLFSLILHECAHGYVAYRCGDPTAKLMGRLSLNPARITERSARSRLASFSALGNP